MNPKTWILGALASLSLATAVCQAPKPSLLHRTRQSSTDLEVGGDLTNVPHGQTRFVTYADLLTLPQETHTVTDDANFVGHVTLSGIALDKLAYLLGASPSSAMVIAICDDSYNAHYPAAYLAAHHPLLILRINGQPPAHWPLGADGSAMGPYMISHPSFTPAFHVLSHADEPQVPWGVLRLDFRNEAAVYEPILPGNPLETRLTAWKGYNIARQNCFRCHSRNGEGGTKSPTTWNDIATIATENPTHFNDYVLHAKDLNPKSQMATSPNYDDETLAALRSYFRTFTEPLP